MPTTIAIAGAAKAASSFIRELLAGQPDVLAMFEGFVAEMA